MRRKRLRRVERLAQLVVRPGIRLLAAVEHLPADLQRLLEPLEPLGERRVGDAEAEVLLLVPGGADPEDPPAAGEDVEASSPSWRAGPGGGRSRR